MDDYVILFSAVGSGLSVAVEQLQGQYDCEVQDIEEVLKHHHLTKQALSSAYPQIGGDITMEDVTYYLPRPKVVELWRSSAQQCLSNLQDSKADFKVLSGHMVYHSGRRNTFYSPIDPKVLRPQARHQAHQPTPQAIAVLIDDAYDMFARLRPPGQLFCDNRIADFLKMACEEQDIAITELSNTENLALVLSWKLSSLNRLLAWRSLEIVMAAHLAMQLDIRRFLVFAAKQRLAAMHTWLADDKSASIYISHPISGPRRQKNSSGHWPPVTSEINSLQSLLLDHSLVAVMPTAIDEYRLDRRNAILQYTGRLSERWPLPDSTAKHPLIYKAPNGNAGPNYYDILYPGFYSGPKKSLESRKQVKDTVLTRLRNAASVLAGRITEEVSSRDHLFVAYCDGVLVYRPFYGGKTKFSGGVQAEVDHWASLVASGVHKRCAFVHFRSEVDDLLARASSDATVPLSAAIRERIWPMLSESEGIQNKQVMESLIKTGQLPAGNVLDKTPRQAEKIEKRYPQLEREAKISYLSDRLTGDHGALHNKSAVWVVDDFDGFREALGGVAQFLKSVVIPKEKWQAEIEDILDDSLWKRKHDLASLKP